MKRRSFAAGLGLAASQWPTLGRTQQAGRQYKLGYLSLASVRTDLVEELAKAGFVDGKNLTIVYAAAFTIGLPAAAAKLVAAGVDVIFAGGDGAALAAQ